jgi:hypothetical protein
MRPSEPAEKYRVVGVRSDGSEAVLARELPELYAEAIRDALDDPRVFFEIRIEAAAGGRDDR